ncbi:MAG: hypothetical protein JRJ31_23080 [Deltaproteobacteria bacterium]|nr:hypothetical protein [Deltaproteobacteria bacterium]
MKIEFTIDRLETAVEKVRKQHPARGHHLKQPKTTILDEMRQKLEACSSDRVASLAYSLDLKRIMACLEILVNEKEEGVAKKAGEVLVLRPRALSVGLNSNDIILTGCWKKL